MIPRFERAVIVLVVAVFSLLSLSANTKFLNHNYGSGTAPTVQDASNHQWIPNTEELIDPDNIPAFMKDYFDWHNRQLERLFKEAKGAGGEDPDGELKHEHEHEHENNYNDDYLANYRFLVLRCTGTDRCGGLSDRLKAFPLFLWYAATTRRILFFRWGNDRPAPIETFLVPGPFWNWTVPDVVMRKIQQLDENKNKNENENEIETTSNSNFTRMYFDPRNRAGRNQMRRIGDQTIWLIEGNDYSGGAHQYEEYINSALKNSSSSSNANALVSDSILQPRDAHYKNFYHDLFHATFRPSPSIEQKLGEYFCDEGNDAALSHSSREPLSCLPVPLQHNRYVVAHHRAKYMGEPFREHNNRTALREATVHAVACAKTRVGISTEGASGRQASAVYVASDAALVLEAARDAYPNPDRTGSRDGDDPNGNAVRVWTNLDPQPLVRNDRAAPANHTMLAVDPPHLNFAHPETLSAFDTIFVDLFLMGYSNCVVYGAGGFGRWGSLVSFRPWCGTAFTAGKGVLLPCEPYE